MPRNAVIFAQDGSIKLILTDVLPEAGRPESGYVVNGGWYWRRRGNTHYALQHYDDSEVDAVTVRDVPNFDWCAFRPTKNAKQTPVIDYADDDIPF